MPGTSASTACRDAAKRAWGRLGAVLAVAALILQMLLPLSAPQAAWVADGLFPPTCTAHPAGAADDSAAADCTQCPLCQVHAGDRLVPPPQRLAIAAFEARPGAAPFAAHAGPPPGNVAANPPLPSRGPPTAV